MKKMLQSPKGKRKLPRQDTTTFSGFQLDVANLNLAGLHACLTIHKTTFAHPHLFLLSHTDPTIAPRSGRQERYEFRRLDQIEIVRRIGGGMYGQVYEVSTDQAYSNFVKRFLTLSFRLVMEYRPWRSRKSFLRLLKR